MLLTKAEILAAADVPHEEVDVPEWGGMVRVQTMTGEARDRYEQAVFDSKSGKARLENIRAKLVAASIVDENGDLVFSDEDIKALGRKSAKALDRVFEAARRLSGLTDQDVEELAKN